MVRVELFTTVLNKLVELHGNRRVDQAWMNELMTSLGKIEQAFVAASKVEDATRASRTKKKSS